MGCSDLPWWYRWRKPPDRRAGRAPWQPNRNHHTSFCGIVIQTVSDRSSHTHTRRQLAPDAIRHGCGSSPSSKCCAGRSDRAIPFLLSSSGEDAVFLRRERATRHRARRAHAMRAFATPRRGNPRVRTFLHARSAAQDPARPGERLHGQEHRHFARFRWPPSRAASTRRLSSRGCRRP